MRLKIGGSADRQKVAPTSFFVRGPPKAVYRTNPRSRLQASKSTPNLIPEHPEMRTSPGARWNVFFRVPPTLPGNGDEGSGASPDEWEPPETGVLTSRRPSAKPILNSLRWRCCSGGSMMLDIMDFENESFVVMPARSR